jgi:hypothetical protein
MFWTGRPISAIEPAGSVVAIIDETAVSSGSEAQA